MALPGRPQAMLRCSPSAPPPAAFQPIAPGAPGATGDVPRNGPRRMEFAWLCGLGDLELQVVKFDGGFKPSFLRGSKTGNVSTRPKLQTPNLFGSTHGIRRFGDPGPPGYTLED